MQKSFHLLGVFWFGSKFLIKSLRKIFFSQLNVIIDWAAIFLIPLSDTEVAHSYFESIDGIDIPIPIAVSGCRYFCCFWRCTFERLIDIYQLADS